MTADKAARHAKFVPLASIMAIPRPEKQLLSGCNLLRGTGPSRTSPTRHMCSMQHCQEAQERLTAAHFFLSWQKRHVHESCRCQHVHIH